MTARFRPVSWILILPLLLAACSGQERKKDSELAAPDAKSEAAQEEYLVRVGDHPLSDADFQAMIPPEFHGLLTVEEKRDYLDRWVDTELLYRSAEARGLLDDPELKLRLLQQQREFVANRLMQKVFEERLVVTESEIADYYVKHLDEYSSEYRYREIVVSSQEEAEDLYEDLSSKRISFTRAAEKHSLSSSAHTSGDMGWLAKGAMPPEVEERIVTMTPQEISRPFETAWGWTIIQFRDKRQSDRTLDLQEVKDEILRYLTMTRRRQVYREYLAELRESHKVIYHPQLEERLRAGEFVPGAEK
jgi:hypothetical protein